MAKSRKKRQRPKKPYRDFPLFPHQSGQWCKTIQGRHYYFGVWDDWEAALEKFQREVDYLQRGKTPPSEQTTLADILNAYLERQQAKLDLGQLVQRTYDEYVGVCDVVAKLGKHRPIDSISSDDLTRLSTLLGKGKSGKARASIRHKVLLAHARQVFNFANESLGTNIRYKSALKPPSAKTIRLARAKTGERMFTPAEIKSLLRSAKPQMRAMILLGINCGFGNEDCATLPVDKLDLENGWHDYHRSKTGIVRRCKLWRETVSALRKAIRVRPEAKNPEHQGLVFITKYGQPWKDENGRNNPLAAEFRKLATELGIYRKGITTFYTLRRTFQTVGETVDRQNTLKFVMGHMPSANDMSAVYRQRTFDKHIQEITTQVRRWLAGTISFE